MKQVAARARNVIRMPGQDDLKQLHGRFLWLQAQRLAGIVPKHLFLGFLSLQLVKVMPGTS
jgi:hypothetical protein